MIDSEMHVAVVTGAYGGLGTAIVAELRRNGYRVVAADVHVPGTTTEDLVPIELDVRDASQWKQLVARVTKEYGSIAVLVNGAGITRRSTVTEMSPGAWRDVLETNLTGAFLGIRAVAPSMIDAGKGSIVSVGSTAAMTSHADPAYAASKWGLRGLSRAAATELGPHGIRTNCVHPNVVRTALNADADETHFASAAEMTPLQREVTPEDVARSVAFLASDDAAAVTGVDLTVDGGYAAAGIATARRSLRHHLGLG